MIQIINGPNLNLLGRREPEIYGSDSFDDFLPELRSRFPGVKIDYFQSNLEGEIIDCIQKCGLKPDCEGIILNPAAYTHYSIAIADAIAAVDARVVEVHISNIHSREPYRRVSVTAEKAEALIAGAGLFGYVLALEYLLNKKR